MPAAYTTAYRAGSAYRAQSPVAYPITGSPTPLLHLHADDVVGNDGDVIATWPARVGTNATQATAGSRPVLKKAANGINGHNVLRGDGADDYMTTTFASPAATAGLTFFYVVRTGAALTAYGTVIGSGGVVGGVYVAATSGVRWALSCGNSPGDDYEAGWGGPGANIPLGNIAAQATNKVWYGRYRIDGAADQWTMDGINTNTVADSSFPTGTFNLHIGCEAVTVAGPTAIQSFNGDIGEIRVYNTALSAADMIAIKAEMQATWGF